MSIPGTTCTSIRRPRAAMATSVPAMAYWAPGDVVVGHLQQLARGPGHAPDQVDHLVEIKAGGLGVDHGQPVGGPAAGVPGDLGLRASPRCQTSSRAISRGRTRRATRAP